MIFSILTLIWQILALFACCLGMGLYLRFLIPKELSFLNKILFSLMGGLFLVVLVHQNLFYVGLPVRISAWLVAAATLVQGWFCRRKLIAWTRTYCSSPDTRALAVVMLLTIAFHGFVPTKQGLEWYYGKGHDDHFNYVLLAEFLKEEPYNTTEQEVGLRPWMSRAVGFQHFAEAPGMNSGPQQAITGLIKERVGQSIVTAEMSAWSGTDGKGGYGATVVFFLALLAICNYVLLRTSGVNCFMAGSGGLLGAVLPAVTRLSLNGFLSQVSILFVFPLLANLLQRREFGVRGFILFFSLALAYLVAAYTEIAPIGFCTLLLGVIFVRNDTFRTKTLIVMISIPLIAVMNPYYLSNLIEFLGKQYYLASELTRLDNLAPNVLTVRGWSELIFGFFANASVALLFDGNAILLGLLFLIGVMMLARRDKLIFGAILLPAGLIIFYLATRIPFSHYAIAKIALTMLPLLIGLVCLPLSRLNASNREHLVGMLANLFCFLILVSVAAGSVRYYGEVLNDDGLLRYVREPRFLSVCRALEEIKNKRVLIFETNPSLTGWLCYHGRHNDVSVNGQFHNGSRLQRFAPVATAVPELADIDFVATRDRIVDLRAASLSCLTLIDDPPGEDRSDGHDRYWLGPAASLRFLAFRAISVNLKMRLIPGPGATTLPFDYLLTDDQGNVSQGEIRNESVAVQRMNLPEGFSVLYLSVKAKNSGSSTETSSPAIAELDGIEISDVDLNAGG
jgi:hypothetical protein